MLGNHERSAAQAPDDYEQITIHVTDEAGKDLTLTSDPDGVTLSDITRTHTPFDELHDPFDLLKVENPSEIYRKRIMGKAHGLARVLTDNRQERRSLNKGNRTKLAEVAIEDICSISFSAKKDDESTTYWLERSDTGAGFMLIENSNGTVLVRTMELDGESAFENATALVENDPSSDQTQDYLFGAADKFLLAFAEAVGIDPEKLGHYRNSEEIPDIMALVDKAEGKTAEHSPDGSILVEVRKIAVLAALATTSFIGLWKGAEWINGYQVQQPEQDDSAYVVDYGNDEYTFKDGAAYSDTSPSVEFIANEVPEQVFYTNPEGVISYILADEFDTSTATQMVLKDGLYEAPEGISYISVAESNLKCIPVTGEFSLTNDLLTGAFHQDPTMGDVAAVRISDTRIDLCKVDGSYFNIGDKLFVVLQPF